MSKQIEVIVRHSDELTFCVNALLTTPLPTKDANLIADTLIEADLRGVYSHGVQLLPRYVRGLNHGINPNPNVKTVVDNKAISIIDGDNGMGQVVANKSMDIAIEKSRMYGLASVSVRNSNHLGALAYYGMKAVKENMIAIIYNMLCVCLGTPPDLFDWQIRDKKKNFKRFKNLTPLDFYKKHVKINLNEKVCLIHCPMSNKKMYEHYTVKYLGNVIGGQKISYANVEVEDMKRASIKSIKSGESVWFGCDVSKMYNSKLGVMDMNLYNYELLFNTDFNMNKQNKLEYGDSVMTHAMLLTAVDMEKNKSLKWRIENSWGDKAGDKGYFLMTDKWFDEYTYEVVIDKKYLPNKIIDIFKKEPVQLNPWDPMGSLAR